MVCTSSVARARTSRIVEPVQALASRACASSSGACLQRVVQQQRAARQIPPACCCFVQQGSAAAAGCDAGKLLRVQRHSARMLRPRPQRHRYARVSDCNLCTTCVSKQRITAVRAEAAAPARLSRRSRGSDAMRSRRRAHLRQHQQRCVLQRSHAERSPSACLTRPWLPATGSRAPRAAAARARTHP
jgi:hypothetical protein